MFHARYSLFKEDRWEKTFRNLILQVENNGVHNPHLFNVAGVDILRSERGPLVMEVNSSPGLEGIEAATGKDVAGMIVEFIEKNAKPNRTRTRGKG